MDYHESGNHCEGNHYHFRMVLVLLYFYFRLNEGLLRCLICVKYTQTDIKMVDFVNSNQFIP
jgi:hypothetical protein